MATVSDLGGALALLGWDRETRMPPSGAETRGQQLGTVAALHHRELVRGDVGEVIAELEAADLDGDRRAMVERSRRDRERAARVPEELVRAEAEAMSRCIAVWTRARSENDAESFIAALTPLLDLKRQVAEALDIGDEPYDALLDEFEPGIRAVELEPIFAELRLRLGPLVEATRSRNGRDELPERRWPRTTQMTLARDLAEAVGFDLRAGVIDESVHPFSQGTGLGDTRFTTHPVESNPTVNILSTLHELGHALYEQGLPAAYARTALWDAPSMGAHESQSRFWENHVGRLQAFWQYVMPVLGRRFPDQTSGLRPEALHRSVTRVRPSLIRVEADEVTYDLHIVLRFRLELALIRGDLAAADLPGAWDDGMEELLGLRPRTVAEGFMQDIHWANGLVGYFPTYTLGNLYAAQLDDALREELDLEDAVARGDFAPVLAFMRSRIHAHGRRLETRPLMREATGRDLGVDSFVAHLERAYLNAA
jgi:carboxypeptidase Taq